MEPIETVALFTSVVAGGTWRYVKEMVEQWRKQGVNTLLIRQDGRFLLIDFWSKSIHDSYTYPYNGNIELLTKIIRTYHVGLIHYQHTLHAELPLIRISKLLDIPYVVTLHDYYLICPFSQLTDENEVYCGEKGVNACQRCLKKRYFLSRTFKTRIEDILFWRKFWGAFLTDALCAIVPNRDVSERFARYYPDVNYRVVENPEIINPQRLIKKKYSNEPGSIKHIGILGRLTVGKGRNVLLECASLADKEKYPFHFYLFGELPDYKGTIPSSLTVLGRYKEEDIYELIDQQNIDFFWFPAVWPETYSYTLTIPIRAGIPVIGTDLGAIGERIRRHHWGETYHYNDTPSNIMKKLLSFSSQKDLYNASLKITNTVYPEVEDYYQQNISRIPLVINPETINELQNKAIWECNHSNLHHLNGGELKRLVRLSTSPLTHIRYIFRLDYKWGFHYFISKILKA